MAAVDARTAALRMLARREHSEAELVRKLVRKQVSLDAARRTVVALSNENLVSDERFAEAFVRVRIRRGFGPARIAADLNERGVDSELIDRWVDRDDAKWRKRCADAAQRKYRCASIENYKDWARRARFLQGRGFTSEQIVKALGRYSDTCRAGNRYRAL